MAKNKKFPVIVERDEDGFYVVQCTVLNGCFTQGKTLDEALKNIREVIGLCLEEKENRDLLASYRPRELSLHTISL
ncbi:MAG: type II toxin-antitoxin system HicB family antitoxin [Candidatus Taylorbacteria bacterium]|nr:type II toxin-antitoxin system HicB family antitoxin [Candidatus Taylorbacteria bacterium]